MKILIIIPAYNEEESILNTVREVQKKCPGIDYLVVNDCSKDHTKKILVNNDINHISHPINLGLSETIKSGFRYALQNHYEGAVQIDGDGQHNPVAIHTMKKMMEDDSLDFVLGSRFDKTHKKPHSLRMLGSRFISLAISIATYSRVYDPTNGMRMFGRHLMHRFVYEANFYVEPDTIAYLIKDGYRWDQVLVKVRPRQFGRSYLTAFKSVMYMTQIMFSILFVQQFRPKKHKYKIKKLRKKVSNAK